MLVLYEWRFADPPSDQYVALPEEESESLLRQAHGLLRARGYSDVADLLTNFRFKVVHPHDVAKRSLRVVATVQDRMRLRRLPWDLFRELARAMGDVGCYVQLIFAGDEASPDIGVPERAPASQMSRGLRQNEVDAVIHGYIGIQHGNLANFTLQSLEEFYRDLDLRIDANRYSGSVRSRFQTILAEADPFTQATILGGVLDKFRVGSSLHRTLEREAEIHLLVDRLLGVAAVSSADLRIRTDVIESALADAEMLIDKRGASSGVDRVHTAFHGYLKEVCRVAALTARDDAGVTELLTMLREKHPAFNQLGPRDEDIKRVLRSMSAIVDALNPLRNKASAAHPNHRVLEHSEAMLVINTVRTLLHYIDSKIQATEGQC